MYEFEFTDDTDEEEEEKLEERSKDLEKLKKKISYDELDEIDNLVVYQTEMVNEKVRKRLELVTPPKKVQTEKAPETPTEQKTQSEQKTSNPLKEVETFNKTFLQESDKLRAKPEVTEEMPNKAKEEVRGKMQIQTVAQVHKDGNELEKIKERSDSLEKDEKKEYLQDKEIFPKREKDELMEESIKESKCVEEKEPELTEEKIIRDDDSDEDSDSDDDDDDVVIVESDSTSDDGLDMEMRSHTPSSMRSSDYAYHLNFIRGQHPHGCPAHHGNCKPSIRKNMSFTNMRLREIERQNEILLKKILTQKPSYLCTENKPRKVFFTLDL